MKVKKIKNPKVFKKVLFVELIAKEEGITKVQAERMIDLIFEKIGFLMKKGWTLRVNHFGIFSTRKLKEREGFDVIRKEKIKIPATKKVKFQASPFLNKEVNED